MDKDFEPLTFSEILAIYRRWYKLAFFTFIGILLPAVVVIFLILPMYKAEGTLWVNRLSPQSQYALQSNTATGSTTFRNLDRQEEISTYAEMVKARSIAEQVVDELDITMESLNRIHDARRYVQAVMYGVIDGVKYVYNQAKLLLGLGTPMSPEMEAELNHVRLIDEFIGRIDVNPVMDSNLLSVSFRSSDPVLARDAVNKILDAFHSFSAEIREESAMTYFQGSSQQLAEELERAESELLSLEDASSNYSIAQQREVLVGRYSGSQDRLRSIEVERSKLEGQLMGYRDRLEEEPETILTQEQGVGNNRQGTVWQVNPIHQELKLRAMNLEIELSSLTQEEDSLRSLLEDYERDLNELGTASLKIRAQERKIEQLEEAYRLNLRNLDGASASQAMSMASLSAVRVVSRAPYPLKPIRPRKLMYLLLAFAGATLLGLGMPFMAYLNDSTLADRKSIREHLGLDFVTVFPNAEKPRKAWYVPKFL